MLNGENMKTNLLIEAETDGDKCGEGCPLQYAFIKNCIFGELGTFSPYKRLSACLAAEAAAKELDRKAMFDDPEVKEAVELAKKYKPPKRGEENTFPRLKEFNIIRKTLLRLAGEEE
jgi:hypothetical protein